MQNIQNKSYSGEEVEVMDLSIDSVDIVPIHKLYGGMKDFTLALLEQLINHLSRKQINNYCLREIIGDIWDIIDHGEEAYKVLLEKYIEFSITDDVKRFEIVQNIISQTNDKDLTKIEKILLYHSLRSILLDIPSISYSPSVDYGAMKIIASFCYRALRKGLQIEEGDIQKVIFPTLTMTSDDTLIDFDVRFTGSVEEFDKVTLEEIFIFHDWTESVIKVSLSTKQIATLEGFSEKSIERLMKIKQQSSQNLINFDEIYSMYMRILCEEITAIDPDFKVVEKLESIFEFLGESYTEKYYKNFYDKVNNEQLDSKKRLAAFNKLLYSKGMLQALDNAITAKRREANIRFLMSGELEY